MKQKIFTVMMLALITATASFGQNKEVRVLLKGNTYMVGNENGLGLEVNGKLVVAKNYRDFKTNDQGQYFAVEAKDGKYGVCDTKGTFIYKCTYYKAEITSSFIRLQTTANAEPKFYSTSAPTTEVQVQKADPLMFDVKTKKMHELSEAEAKKIAAQDPFAAFEFRTNSKGRQELYVDGKKLYEAKTFDLISTYDYWKKTTCFFFIITDKVTGRSKDAYGLFGLSIYSKDGKKVVETLLAIPLEYSYISPSKGTTVDATTFSGARKAFDWYGQPIVPK